MQNNNEYQRLGKRIGQRRTKEGRDEKSEKEGRNELRAKQGRSRKGRCKEMMRKNKHSPD